LAIAFFVKNNSSKEWFNGYPKRVFLSLAEIAEGAESFEFLTESLRGGFCPNHCAARSNLDVAYYHPFSIIKITP
jgi:hypothetical protein